MGRYLYGAGRPTQKDKLLLTHDEDDPVTKGQNFLEGVRLIATSEPERCSGKAPPLPPDWRPQTTIVSSERTTRSITLRVG